MDIQEVQERIVKEFGLFEDWTERYKYIIKHGDRLEPLPDEDRTEDNLVKGCQSQVWLKAYLEGERIIFKADSDAAITKGLVSLVVRLYSNQEPEDILSTNPDFISKIGMQQHLSPTRANGLASMIKQMKIYAMAYKSKLQAS
ncbi:MAG TPA: Fe-S metabolism protein SufE [Balneola sp.]|jgi:cysteine desulfuration protein SufE|nr:Fe-S metabolism protein SufE [Bacteroidota bacterium]MAC06310.1 Fe-S metabolism protein SufE [Balneola sp.]MAO77260.1 Fe-S metabolism protein SufE [Balneola sp.]MBF63026.1 Fe-S metabolism protein SufE [Balneola sp.]HAH52084.1 Fe-S metabolism protein SufE [Balneola sp.]|tara:strand:+ start:2285 stop:2713 length:429 start_codon:yes stop_codon:yes gene_type:complete